MLDTLAQHIHHAAFGDLALQPGQKLQPWRAIRGEPQLLEDFWLGGPDSCSG